MIIMLKCDLYPFVWNFGRLFIQIRPKIYSYGVLVELAVSWIC